MRGSLVLVCAGLAGVVGLSSGGCSKKKDEAPPAPSRTGPAAAGVRGGDQAANGPGTVTPPPGNTEGAQPAQPTGGGATGPDPSFELATEQPAAVAASATATARLVVHPAAGMKMNTDFPTGLTLTPPAGVTLPKASLTAAEAEKFDHKELAFAVPMSAAAAGQYKVPGTFKFAVCDEGACYPKKRAVELLLTVQ